MADVAYRRAGGRRRRNAEQQLAKAVRRHRLLGMMCDTQKPLGFVEWGWQTRAPRDLGVGRATTCRDIDALLGEMIGSGTVVGTGFEVRITCRLLRALLLTKAEKQIHAPGSHRVAPRPVENPHDRV